MTPGESNVSVRVAREGDAEEIATVMIRHWRHSYVALLPPGTLERLDHSAATAQWRESIATPPSPAHRVLVALAGTDVAGYAVLAPGDEPDAGDEGLGELLDLVVDPERQRLGHGSRLLSAAADHFRDLGLAEILTWTPELDAVRTEFFRSAGMEADGGVRVLESDDAKAEPVRQIRVGARLT